jgi:hypothetical protein
MVNLRRNQWSVYSGIRWSISPESPVGFAVAALGAVFTVLVGNDFEVATTEL